VSTCARSRRERNPLSLQRYPRASKAQTVVSVSAPPPHIPAERHPEFQTQRIFFQKSTELLVAVPLGRHRSTLPSRTESFLAKRRCSSLQEKSNVLSLFPAYARAFDRSLLVEASLLFSCCELFFTPLPWPFVGSPVFCPAGCSPGELLGFAPRQLIRRRHSMIVVLSGTSVTPRCCNHDHIVSNLSVPNILAARAK